MQLFAFTEPQTNLASAYAGEHSLGLMLLALAIAILAAFASFSHTDLIRRRDFLVSRLSWHLVGAFAMGVGVWAMHFIGMLSFQLPLEMSYHAGMTLLSVVPAVLAGYITLYVIAYKGASLPNIVGGGVLMGLGIGSMHYLGMSAMLLNAERLYDPIWFVLSIVIAALLATAALAVRPWLAGYIGKRSVLNLCSSVVMGFAIVSMHYVAMHATVFLPLESAPVAPTSAVLDSGALITIAVGIAVFIMVISTVAVVMRSRLHSAERHSEEAAQHAEALQVRLQTITQRVPGMVYEFRRAADGKMSFPYASEAVRDIFGVTPEQVQDDAYVLLNMVHHDDIDEVLHSIQRSAETMQVWHHEFRICRDDGEETQWILGNAVPAHEEGGAISWSGFITDVTERKRSDDIINHLAHYDSLTKLPNRRLIYQQLADMIASVNNNPCQGAAYFIDLDNFKRLNDSQGHAAGDLLLCCVAERLQGMLPSEAMVGRLSSDEYIVMVPGFARDNKDAVPVVEKLGQQIMQRLNQVFDLDGHEFECALSIGICMFNDNSMGADDILKRADIAMHEAKQAGGNQVRLFDPAMQARLEHRYELEQALRRALSEDELSLHWQPQMNDQGRVIGAEALLRWQQPQFGQVSPADFIPVAEDTGLIVPIGLWVIEQACEQLKRWSEAPQTAHLSLSVNVSARQFYQPDFPQQVLGLVDRLGIDASKLILELTESLVLEDMGLAIKRMHVIKAQGVRFSMDDFGTGYSSLSYLAELPFDEVKIDQSFIRDASMKKADRDWIIIEAIIALASKLGMAVIAEGVESQLQLDALRQRGCGAFQGFYFSKPLPMTQFTQFLTRRHNE
ncbi:EAL domain-containing protein [Aliidiomarina sp. Khilg15.8]